ncbi:polyketide synthase family protein [Mycolicibacterium chubuense NBB4]|uniref:Polyketide synthase family protein n=1 Tax=Mycolicibacterium chubuense (strain NBB4) TaxID=710421 RepID=I4BJR4_MYCCN|nr:type I polyketide synthase [Mycolicibacterium chubuense]AFM17521.1 polyketide synthase family protein [Mycolicibacterium chubuense NBB4]
MTFAFDEDALRNWLVDYLVTNIGCSPDEIDLDAPLSDLAVGSSDAVVLTGELSELLGRTVSPVEFWQYPTINALAKFLTGGEVEPLAEANLGSGAGRDHGADDEPIAVVGLGLRFPGDDGNIEGPEQYWQFLAEGRSAVRQVPADRWESFQIDSPEAAAALAGTSRWGSFLRDIDAFDAEFFDISPSEADKMDPQQRLMLEVTQEALEHAGIPAHTLRHSQTGVFAAACLGEYGYLSTVDLGDVDSWSGTGGALSIIANRVSYFFDLRGPSVTIDTACSSSLVTIHLACQSLRAGDSNLALAAGVNLLLSPAVTRSFDQLEAMSKTGQCHAFDAGADGFVRGEGCGVAVLKRLSDAQRDGDRILAVIRGSAVNQDGRSNGLMAPNPAAQMAVLRSAYAAAGVEPRDVDYVEAHGTGTLLGDPIEARALGTVLGRGRAADAPLLLGAVKSNLGHLEAAAGIAGFAKAVLALQHNQIPANRGYEKPNPHIPFDNLRLKVVAEPTDWTSPQGRPRRAGISSFGFGGTNAHVVIEQAPRTATTPRNGQAAPAATTLILSGKSPERIASQAAALADWMAGPGADVSLADVAHTLNHHRTQHGRFASVVARDRDQAIAGLQALAAGQTGPGVVPAQMGPRKRGTVFVYSGQGSQWAGMGRQLLADEPAFANAVAEIEPVFVEQVGFSLHDILAGGRPVTGDAQVQPVLMGLQLALTELWRCYGVHPDAVIGHSMGEVTAAVVAGALSLADGLKVIAQRSTIMSRLAGQGAVALVELDPDAAEAFVADHPSVEVAGYVSPRQTVVAGLPDEIDAVIAAVAGQDRFARRVNMEVASHTALMDPVLDDLRAALADLVPRTPTIPFLSTVAEPDSEPTLDADYWVANVRRPVRFSQAIAAAAAAEEIGTFIEVSANPILTYAINDTVASAQHHVSGTLARDADDTLTFHSVLNATLTSHPPETVHHSEPHVALPRTPWHHTSHWAIKKRAATGATAPRPGTVLGAHTAVAGPLAGHLWQARLAPQAKPYPNAHRFAGVEIVPLSVLLQTLSLAASQSGASALTDVRFDFPIALDSARVVQVFSDGDTITVSSAPAGAEAAAAQRWTRHVTAQVSAGSRADTDSVGAVDGSGYDPAALPELHNAWGIEGLAYPWTVESHESAQGEQRTTVGLAEASVAAALDAAVNLARLVDASTPGLMVPSSVAGVRFVDAPAEPRAVIAVRNRGRDGDDLVVDIAVTTADGASCVDLRGVRYSPVDSDAAAAVDADPRRVAHRLEWRPWSAEPAATAPATGSVAVIGDDGLAAALREQVTEGADVDDARYIVYVADSTGDSDQDVAVRLTTEVSALVGRLAERDPRNPATLWIVTRGVRESASEGALRQSPLWGLAGVIGAEQPQLWGGLVDVSEADTESDTEFDTASALVGVVPTAIKSVAVLRDGQFLVSSLAEMGAEPARETLRCRPDAAYLITGGLGVLGLLMADWLADRGARRVVLAGRTALPPRRQWDEVTDTELRDRVAAIRALEKRGVSVDTVALDIGSREAVTAMLDKRDADGAPPIRGVIHAAGMTEAQLLTEIERDRVHRTVWPKVAGARVLDEVFGPGSLDFLYLAASAGAVFGIPGQGAYAAGNAYLDALARSRHRAGDNTVSLDWVAWQGLGFGSDAAVVVSELERVGSRPVTATEAFAAWDFVTRFDVDQVVMAPMHSAEDAATVAADAHRPSAPTRNWSAMSAEELRTELESGLRTILATELRLPESDVHTDRPFAEMGLNSVMAMSIRREVERLVGLELSATMLFNHPTIGTFADYLAKQVAPDLEAGGDDAAEDSGDSLLDSLFDSIESN